jgi:hypothetical protein
MIETPPIGPGGQPRDEPTESAPSQGGETAPTPEQKEPQPATKAVKGTRRRAAAGPTGRQRARAGAVKRGKRSTRAAATQVRKKKKAVRGGAGRAGAKSSKAVKGSPKAKRRKGSRGTRARG